MCRRANMGMGHGRRGSITGAPLPACSFDLFPSSKIQIHAIVKEIYYLIYGVIMIVEIKVSQ